MTDRLESYVSHEAIQANGSDDHMQISEQIGPNRNTYLFLSLFLLILAFFILLVSISTIETYKSQTVMDSLTSVFASPIVSDVQPTEFTTRDGEVLSNPQFQSDIADLFSTMINVTRIDIILPGQIMRVKLPTKIMFKNNEFKLRDNIRVLLDRVIANLSARPPGQRFEAQLVMSVPETKQKPGQERLSIKQLENITNFKSLTIKRAGFFAETMINLGAPRDSIVVGVEPGDPEQMTIWFYVRDLLQQPVSPVTVEP